MAVQCHSIIPKTTPTGRRLRACARQCERCEGTGQIVVATVSGVRGHGDELVERAKQAKEVKHAIEGLAKSV